MIVELIETKLGERTSKPVLATLNIIPESDFEKDALAAGQIRIILGDKLFHLGCTGFTPIEATYYKPFPHEP
jgi:hypothetical protein